MSHKKPAPPVSPVSPKPAVKPDSAVESVRSILALLRGIGPTLVGSSPTPEAVTDLLAKLKDPEGKS